MIEDAQALLQVAGTLQAALGDLDNLADTSPAAVHLQWAIDLLSEQAQALSAMMLVPAAEHGRVQRRASRIAS